MADFVSFQADTATFNSFVNNVLETTGDLRVPFIQIGQDIFKSNRKLFLLRGPGKFRDLSDNPPGKGYKSKKSKKLGSAYPILRGFTGDLEKSITRNTDKNSVFRVSKTSFTVGTKARSKKGFLYPLALQEGTSKMPARPFLFIDKPRVGRWTDIIATYLDSEYQSEGWTG